MHVCCVVFALKKRNSWLSAASRFYPLATTHRDLKIIYCAYTGIELLARLIGSISINTCSPSKIHHVDIALLGITHGGD